MLPQNCLVESLTGFTYSIEYKKGWDNTAADALSWVTLMLNNKTVKSILDGVTLGSTERVDSHDPVVSETDKEIHKQVHEAATLLELLIHLWTYM